MLKYVGKNLGSTFLIFLSNYTKNVHCLLLCNCNTLTGNSACFFEGDRSEKKNNFLIKTAQKGPKKGIFGLLFLDCCFKEGHFWTAVF